MKDSNKKLSKLFRAFGLKVDEQSDENAVDTKLAKLNEDAEDVEGYDLPVNSEDLEALENACDELAAALEEEEILECDAGLAELVQHCDDY